MDDGMPTSEPDRVARVAIVIVTYNSADVLDGCLRSLCSSGVHLSAVVVADNASKDESVAIAEAATDLPIQIVQLGRNAGYAAAVNAGIASLDIHELDAVFVMNPDCRLRPGTLGLLANALDESRRGMAVPRLVNPDGTLQPSLRRVPSVRRALVESIMGGERAGRLGTLGELITDPREYERPGPAAWATGAAMLISVQAVRDVGPWDESFLLYSEETEYALRAADRGWILWYEPAAVVEHIGGDVTANPKLAALLAVNRVRLFRQRHGSVSSAAYHVAMVAGATIRALAGRPTSWASLLALVKPSRRELITRSIIGEPP
jgi:N-acetylglucosaminyl-diphospho-decaprenol L-rhamnosyltransferase